MALDLFERRMEGKVEIIKLSFLVSSHFWASAAVITAKTKCT